MSNGAIVGEPYHLFCKIVLATFNCSLFSCFAHRSGFSVAMTVCDVGCCWGSRFVSAVPVRRSMFFSSAPWFRESRFAIAMPKLVVFELVPATVVATHALALMMRFHVWWLGHQFGSGCPTLVHRWAFLWLGVPKPAAFRFNAPTHQFRSCLWSLIQVCVTFRLAWCHQWLFPRMVVGGQVVARLSVAGWRVSGHRGTIAECAVFGPYCFAHPEGAHPVGHWRHIVNCCHKFCNVLLPTRQCRDIVLRICDVELLPCNDRRCASHVPIVRLHELSSAFILAWLAVRGAPACLAHCAHLVESVAVCSHVGGGGGVQAA